MKLLFRSMLRHIRHHALQTGVTLAVTILITAMLSALFFFVSGFRALLEQHALENVGSYHYRYYAPSSSETAPLLRRMAKDFSDDRFFSEVLLEEQEDTVSLKLTVASPGVFMTRRTEAKLAPYIAAFHRQFPNSIFFLGRDPNFDLLVAYGDLDKSNGMFAFLAVFLLLFSIIALTSFFALGAVLFVSAIQREREFALLMSIGADDRQIKRMLLSESACYLVLALPTGYGLGLLFFACSRTQIDHLLGALDRYPPIQIIFSLPATILLLLSAFALILASSLLPANRAAKLRPIEALRQTQSMFLPKREQRRELSRTGQAAAKRVSRSSGAAATLPPGKTVHVVNWLALKNQRRFRRRFRPVLLTMTVTFLLCFVLSGFRRYTTQASGLTYLGGGNNLSIRLYCDETAPLDELAQTLIRESDGQLVLCREALFALKAPYPLSEEALLSGLGKNGQMPDLLLLSIDEASYADICAALALRPTPGALEGIFLGAEQTWVSNGSLYHGIPYALSAGDTLTFYRDHAAAPEDGLELAVLGVWNEFPPYTAPSSPVRLVLLVSEETLLALQPLRPSAGREAGLYSLSLRGLLEDASRMEETARRFLSSQSAVSGSIENLSAGLASDLASISGFRFLMRALITALLLVCVCSNFIVSFSIASARRREFAALICIGMTPGQLRRMRWAEQLLLSALAFFPGCLLGGLCCRLIYHVYALQYAVTWAFPWQGLAMSLAVLLASLLLTGLAMHFAANKSTLADALRSEE